MAGKTLRLEQVAELFGVSEASIKAWRREGMPVKTGGGHGKPIRFDRDACIAWAAKHKKKSVQAVTGVKEEPEKEQPPDFLDPEQERAKLTREQKLLARDKRRIVRGRFLRRSVVQAMVNDAVSWFRNEMEGFDRTIDASAAIRNQIRARMTDRLTQMAEKLHKVPSRVAKAQKDQYIKKIDREGKPNTQ